MQTKISLVGLEARNKVIKGMDYVADAIKATLGPYGLNALLEKGNRPTNDGYTISSELAGTLEDEFERRGALALHEASSKTNDEVGDATSTVQALTQAIIKESLRYLPTETSLIAKKKPSEITQMISQSRDMVIEKLKSMKQPIETEEQLIASAKVSVEDEELAQLIGSTQWQIGPEGFILVDETIEPKSSIEVVKGIRLDNGFASTNFITDQANQTADISDISVVLTNYTIGKEEVMKLKASVIDPLIAAKKDKLVIVARAFTAEAIQLCNETSQKGFLLWALNAPYVYQDEIMKDLSAITGATYFAQEEARLEDINVQDIGFAKKIMARRFDGIVTGVEDMKRAIAIAERAKTLEERLTGEVSDFERKAIQARIAQFRGGFAILKVGAETVFERKYKKDKADDAVNSVRLALQEGTVKGAGLAFKEISEQLEDNDILKKPLLCVYNQIMSSAPEGFVIEDWVRDPYLTLVSALKNACSVASQFGSINAVVTTKDKKDKDDEKTN